MVVDFADPLAGETPVAAWSCGAAIQRLLAGLKARSSPRVVQMAGSATIRSHNFGAKFASLFLPMIFVLADNDAVSAALRAI